VIRCDIPGEILHAAAIVRAINSQRVSRNEVDKRLARWPSKGVCWRGGGFKVG